MSVENGKCPGCGQIMSLDNSKEKMTCKYCGSEMVITQAIQKCQIDGITSVDSLILAAEQALNYDEDFDKALKKYKEALSLRPEDYRVLWGIFLCEIESIKFYKRTKGYVQFQGDLNDVIAEVVRKYGQRAYDMAPDDVKPYYFQKIEEARALSETKKKKKGCYIATAVYGSYNCPQVWTLRRYRDNNLDKSFFGKLFIKVYYAFSPIVIRLFGKTKWFNKFCRKRLDKKVWRLQAKGVESTPYDDKY